MLSLVVIIGALLCRFADSSRFNQADHAIRPPGRSIFRAQPQHFQFERPTGPPRPKATERPSRPAPLLKPPPPIDRRHMHFQSARFCEDYTLGLEREEPDLTNFENLRQTINDDFAVLQCVAAVEILALPFNLYQDFRWAFNTISQRRQTEGNFKQLMKLPFTLMNTVARMPFNIFKNLLKAILRLFVINRSIYIRYG